ncbi:MAG: aldo/keto reductase [Bacteroidales bacterium]|nr:aldo/keto reductase [Clostridium sp.]MCM1204239.1 aldo/keto reductase [Bacteroidales bacterium]
MQYRNDRNGNPISLLGYGCMRFTKKGGSIDLDKAEKEIMEAVRLGVNYFDTAYIYGGSEVALGEILARNNCRGDIAIATKLPQYLIKSEASIEKYFHEQCERLKTDYIDYYLMHMLTDIGAWEKLKRLGIEEWIDGKKKEGKIRNLGFSFHGNTEKFLEILNAYDWDFCQIQYNYLDEHSQAGRKGLQAAAEKGIPVIIMEPLRGGKLVDLLPEKAKKRIAGYRVKRTPAEWAFRWLYNQPEVTCVLSGMNTLEMVRENCAVASDAVADSFTEEDFALIEQVKEEINRNMKVGCTGCGYCMPCPRGIDIPTAFRCYNQMYTEHKRSGRFEYLQCLAYNKDRADIKECVECGKCESHCPQHLEIRRELKNARKALLPVHYNLVTKLMRLFKFW